MSTESLDVAGTVDSVMRGRRTTRAFLPNAVPRQTLIDVLDVARTAPSTFNTQPWGVHVLIGAAKQQLSEALQQAHASKSYPHHAAVPPQAPSEVSARQREFFRRYYDILGIDPSDTDARYAQTSRNFAFFDAPVGLIFTIDESLTRHSWLDVGLFLQNVMLAAQARGLATCPQVSFVRYQSVIAETLGLRNSDAVVCGMSLGWPDDSSPVNRMDMPREPILHIAQWHGFDGP